MTNKMKHVLAAGVVCCLCAAGSLVWTGCDTASSTDNLVITPSAVTLSSGQSQQFNVSGGYHYTWALSGSGSSSGTTSSAQGSLSSLVGSQVLYSAPTSDTLSGSVVIQVTSTIQGSGAGSSNSPAYSVSGEAIVTFK